MGDRETDSPELVVPASGVDGLEYFGPSSGWRLLDLRELWRFRELIWILAYRDLKVRYRQAVVGVAWVVLQPLATALVFVLLFGLLGKTPDVGGIPYGVFVLPGVVLWQLFANIVGQGTMCLVVNQILIGKVYFPRIALPLSVAVTALVDFAVGAVVVAVVMAAYGDVPGWQVVLAPVFVLLGLIAAIALALWTSALNAIYRDTGYAVPFLLQMGMFVSPVVYSTVLIPARWKPVLELNPMTGVIEGFRWSLFGSGSFPAEPLLIGSAATAVVFLTGLWYFRRVEGYLADRI